MLSLGRKNQPTNTGNNVIGDDGQKGIYAIPAKEFENHKDKARAQDT